MLFQLSQPGVPGAQPGVPGAPAFKNGMSPPTYFLISPLRLFSWVVSKPFADWWNFL